MPTQLCYIINRNPSIHSHARFHHRMFCYISWQPCILSRSHQKFSDLVFSKGSSIVPDRIARRSAMVYCHEKGAYGFLHFVRKMAGKLKIKTNWTALVIDGVGFWTKSPAVAVSLSRFWSSFGFPHKDLLSTNWIIIEFFLRLLIVSPTVEQYLRQMFRS